MRCIFTMFAEDSGLLPEDGFRTMLADLEGRPGATLPSLLKGRDQEAVEDLLLSRLVA